MPSPRRADDEIAECPGFCIVDESAPAGRSIVSPRPILVHDPTATDIGDEPLLVRRWSLPVRARPLHFGGAPFGSHAPHIERCDTVEDAVATENSERAHD